MRRQTLHQFLDAGIALYNPDKPERPVNSPDAVYQVSPEALRLFRSFGTKQWASALAKFLSTSGSLAEKNARIRDFKLVPISLADGKILKLSPGKHSELIARIVDTFTERFAPGSKLLYAGDTGEKFAYFDEVSLRNLGININNKGKMPDVVLHFDQKSMAIVSRSGDNSWPSRRQEA